MQTGHYYALLVNNFSSGNNGFTLAFTDQAGKAGTAEFVAPKAAIIYAGTNDCTAGQQYTFTSQSANYDNLEWSFGQGASTATGNLPGPYTITYSTPGLKTITLTAKGEGGCFVVATQQLAIGAKPPLPVISPDKPSYCLYDTVKLSTGLVPGATYAWTGPNGYKSDASVAVIPLTSEAVAGTYNLIIKYNECSSDVASIVVPGPLPSPTAEFETTPSLPTAEYGPLEVQFKNLSLNAESYLWDFGDGSTSTELNPVHTYNSKGEYTVKLTAFRLNSCRSSVAKAKLAVILKDSYIFIPNIFSPNGDGVNDEFKVTITNIKSYHVLIFNRWGQALFESKDININWNGLYKGVPVPYGAYYYKIIATGNNNKIINQSGSITLVK